MSQTPYPAGATGEGGVIAMLGLPEDDAVTPFVLATPLEGGMAAAVVAGTVHAGGVQGVDGGEMSIARLAGIVLGLREQGDLVDVPAHGMAHFLLHATEQPEVKATLGRLPAGVRNASQILDPLREEATQAEPGRLGSAGALLVEGRQAVVFGLPDGAVGPAVEATMQAMRAAGGDAGRRAALAGVIDATADAALLVADVRARWAFALDVLTWRSRVLGHAERADQARQTAIALRAGARGRDVVFVRAWTERQLAQLAESALRRAAR
ncbi:MAG: hypothetical protein VX265_06010 [Myxococcota bacterium]|nr:hypothetical protein [Myxococcota bacterium]